MRKIVATLTRTNGMLTRSLGLVMVFVFTVILLTQLYTFDRFPGVISSALGLPVEVASVICGVIVLAELLSLPFLLNIPLSTLMRVLSVLLGFVVLGFWAYVSLIMRNTFDPLRNTGIAGDTVIIPGGWWFVYYLAGLIVIYVWYSVRMVRSK